MVSPPQHLHSLRLVCRLWRHAVGAALPLIVASGAPPPPPSAPLMPIGCAERGLSEAPGPALMLLAALRRGEAGKRGAEAAAAPMADCVAAQRCLDAMRAEGGPSEEMARLLRRRRRVVTALATSALRCPAAEATPLSACAPPPTAAALPETRAPMIADGGWDSLPGAPQAETG